MQINLICQGCGKEIPTGAWYNTQEGITILVPSVCECMSAEPPKKEIDEYFKDVMQDVVNEYGREAVIKAAEGMVRE